MEYFWCSILLSSFNTTERVHFADLQSMDYPIWTTKWITLMDFQMDYLMNYPRKRKERNITPSLFVLIDSLPIRHLVFISITGAQIICRRINCRI